MRAKIRTTAGQRHGQRQGKDMGKGRAKAERLANRATAERGWKKEARINDMLIPKKSRIM